MDLPVMPPVAPMLAKAVKDVPTGDLSYEPKWDGFRSVIFRDGDEVEIGSRNGKPMTRYFPEVVEAVLANFPERAVIDGEIVVVDPVGESGWSSRFCSSASTRRSAGSPSWPRRRRRASSPSTCSRWATRTGPCAPSPSGGRRSRRPWPRRSPRST